MLGSLMLLGVSGAIAALGDTLFPVTSWAAGFAQDLSPSAHLFVRLRVLHPVIAVIATFYVLYVATRRQSSLGIALLIAIFAQVMLGAMNLVMLAPVWMQLIHLLAADAVWILAVLYSADADEAQPFTTRIPASE